MNQHRPLLPWPALGWLLLPTAPLTPLLAVYFYFGGTPHFFLHTFMGWDVALLVILGTTLRYGTPWSQLDGLIPAALAFYAMIPDIIYALGPPHRDWMDVFLFHISLDVALPFALPTLAMLWVALVWAYVWFRVGGRFAAAGGIRAGGLPFK